MNYKEYLNRQADIDFMSNRLSEIEDDKIKNQFINGIEVAKATLVNNILWDLRISRGIYLNIGLELPSEIDINNKHYILRNTYIQEDDKVVLVVSSNDSGFNYQVSDKIHKIVLSQ